jgi:iron complex transport system ATP-binding protein
MNTSILTTEHLTIGYRLKHGDHTVVSRDINQYLHAGEFVCLIGPNGAGKSTLLRTVAGLHEPLEGRVMVEAQELHSFTPKELAKRIGIVTTERVNVGMFTGWALVSLGRFPYTDWTGKLTFHDEAVVEWALKAVDAYHLRLRNVGELSDGERQKIMIARALAQDPHIIILDEPTAFLDLPRRVEIMGILKQLTRDTAKGIVLSTHDLELATQVADIIWLISAEGEIEVGAPEDHVLSGSLERNFTTKGVSFDKQKGSFIVNKSHKGRVGLLGEGLVRLWTEKALHREGFQVEEGGSPEIPLVRCYNREHYTWELDENGARGVYYSLYELLSALRGKSI